MKKLDQIIEEFSQAIKETKEYQNYQKANQAFFQDLEAQKLLKQFQEGKQKLAILKEGNFSGQQEQKEKFESLLSQVRKNKVINERADSLESLQKLIDKLASKLSEEIDFPFTYIKKKKSCCS